MKIYFQKSLYSTAMLLAPALVTPPLLFFKRGRERIGNRYGLWNIRLEGSLWLHGASLGEMVGLSNIARELKQRLSDLPIVASCTSPTGLSKAKEFALATKLLPFDHPLYFQRCIRAISPKVFIFGETEIWPNLLYNLHRSKIPAYLVNGKISERTFSRYYKFKELVADSLRQIDHIFAATEQSKERFIALGARPQNLSVINNTKYDNQTTALFSEEQKITLKNALFESTMPVVILSSIRPGEEEVLFRAIKSAERRSQILSYVIAPRHAEKFSYFENKLRDFKFDFDIRSKVKVPSKKRFLLLDTIGELNKLLPAADLVFVGGTFVDYGGHNPLEPAAFGIAAAIGPYSSTVRDVVQNLRAHNALLEPRSEEEVVDILSLVAQSSQELRDIGNRSRETALSLTGGSKLIVDQIENEINLKR